MNARPRLFGAALLLATWLGAALLVVAVVTPAAFAVLPSRSMAGTMVGRVLPVLFTSGLLLSVTVAILAGSGRASAGAAVTALLSGAACAVAQFGIDPRIAQLRAELGGSFERLPADDPRRVAFGLLHGYSVAALGVAMLAAILALAFVLVALRSRS
jgi:hypothetical protein